MTTAARPEYRSRCGYCGEPQNDKLYCRPCGEAHWEEVPECPDCGGEVDHISTTYQGIETSAWSCNNCAWVGDPE